MRQPQHSTLGTFFNKLKKFDCFGLFRSHRIEPQEPVIEETPRLPSDLIEKTPHKSSEEYMTDAESTEALHSYDSSSTIDSLYWNKIRREDKNRTKLLNEIAEKQSRMIKPIKQLVRHR
jgi:hypothetical protein